MANGSPANCGDLRPDLTGVTVERVAADQNEIEPTLPLQCSRQGPGGGQGVRSAERRIAQMHPPVRPPGDGLTEHVVRRRRPEREDGAGAAALPGPLHPLGDGTPAVGVHFELDPLPDEPSVVTQRHRLPHRDLLDQGGNPQRPIEPACRDLV